MTGQHLGRIGPRRTGARPATVTPMVTSLVILMLAVACAAGPSNTNALPPGERPTATMPAGTDCNWPMWGQNQSRTFSYPCPTSISPATAKNLDQRWFFNAQDVVTATPAVVDGSVFVGDWSGRFYALDAETGAQKWTFQAPPAPNVYAGQIVASAAVAEVGGVRTVFFASGPVMYALRASDGTQRWKVSIGSGEANDFTEIESSPIVAAGKVIFGSDVHNRKGQKAGVYALDAETGTQRWFYDTDEGKSPSGCVDVWGSAAVDELRRAVYFGTGSCDTKDMDWRPNSEALVAIDLDKGTTKWRYQPHKPSADDLDFAGAPNLFDANGTPTVGLGNKDGSYYALQRDTGRVLWKTEVTKGSRTGGFIGPTAYARGIIAGGTAVGGAPFLHGLDANTGRIIWQQPKTQATYAAAAEANGVLFSGGSDFTFRAIDLKTGEILWSRSMPGVVAGGAAIVGDDVFAVVGIREPGLDKRSEKSGVFRFSTKKAPAGSPTSAPPSTTGTAAPPARGIVLTNAAPEPCIGRPCPFEFSKPLPAGLQPTTSVQIDPDPFLVTVKTSGLGDPGQWLTPGTDAAGAGATQFAVFASESDDNPVGGLLCVLDARGECSADTLPRLATYNRITILAVNDPTALPAPADGLARLVYSVSFAPPLTPKR